jgi:hypothetical protein
MGVEPAALSYHPAAGPHDLLTDSGVLAAEIAVPTAATCFIDAAPGPDEPRLRRLGLSLSLRLPRIVCGSLCLRSPGHRLHHLGADRLANGKPCWKGALRAGLVARAPDPAGASQRRPVIGYLRPARGGMTHTAPVSMAASCGPDLNGKGDLLRAAAQ